MSSSVVLLQHGNCAFDIRCWGGTIRTNTPGGQAEFGPRQAEFDPRACPRASLIFWHRNLCPVGQVFLLKRYSTAGEGGTDGGTAAASEQGSDRRALDTCRTLLTRRGLESTGAVPCVSPECGNWMVPEGGGQRVRCDSCLIEFCRR